MLFSQQFIDCKIWTSEGEYFFSSFDFIRLKSIHVFVYYRFRLLGYFDTVSGTAQQPMGGYQTGEYVELFAVVHILDI